MDFSGQSGLLVAQLSLMPSAEKQVAFLQNIQRLFEEGEFTATYKFALLMALTEISVERWSELQGDLRIPIIAIAEKFAEFYWPQTLEYSSGIQGSSAGILTQNLGRQAAVINILQEVRRKAPTLTSARKLPEWPKVIARIARVVRDQPVRYLQNIASNYSPFLYDYPPPQGELILRADAAANLARYQGLIQQLARAAWIDHIRTNKRNEPILGRMDDLEAFMFGTSRSALEKIGAALADIDGARCFYCEKPLSKAKDVDHFIPWSKYPRDLGHNLVLSHPECNRSKSDTLAARPHLEKWVSRINSNGLAISLEMNGLGVQSDADCLLSVGKWAYLQGMETHSQGWLRPKKYESITSDYLRLFPCHP